MTSAMAARLTGRIGLGMLAPLALAATAIFGAPVANAQENTGWTGWQSLGSAYPDALPGELPFRLSTAVSPTEAQ